ncbi:MAG TPA: sulfite oxidase [Gemmatimonadales bacterium]|nr:sulfite oxidase [Gemmatimonadales bacterium]
MPSWTEFRGAKDPSLRVLDAEFGNAGPAPEILGDDLITPTTRFFIRSHGDVPVVDPASWRLEVAGAVRTLLRLSLDDLRGQFPRQTVTATLVCAGLRRDELAMVRPVVGELPWGLEPIGTAVWSGVPLREILQCAGVSPDARHVEGIGLDQISRRSARFGFGGSIPLAKALEPEVLVALEMNGEPLPVLHGGPARLVVPGFIGARSVKWLGGITLRSDPSENYFQAEAYRVLANPAPGDPRDVRRGVPLDWAPLNAAILCPEAEAVVPAGPVLVSGWAFAGETRVRRVEVSGDDGRIWCEAALQGTSDPWAWVFWRVEVDLAPGRRLLAVRAWDEAGRRQPEHLAEVWNVKGYVNNAWHRVPVEVR